MNDVTTPAAKAAGPDYISDQQQRILGLILTLAGHEVDGLAPSQIASLNECNASQVTRDLANLKHIGWAEQLPVTGRWRLGPQIVQIALRHMVALDRAARRLEEIKNRFTPGLDDAQAGHLTNRYVQKP